MQRGLDEDEETDVATVVAYLDNNNIINIVLLRQRISVGSQSNACTVGHREEANANRQRVHGMPFLPCARKGQALLA